MNNDLISREALKKHKVRSEERHEYVVPVYNIDNAPTIAPERPQGEWKYTHDTFSKRICNKCNYSQVIVDGMADNFCPNCGAKMKGGAK